MSARSSTASMVSLAIILQIYLVRKCPALQPWGPCLGVSSSSVLQGLELGQGEVDSVGGFDKFKYPVFVGDAEFARGAGQRVQSIERSRR